jgi:hypothetical protein
VVDVLNPGCTGPQLSRQAWKALFVIFEHGNIADATTYHTLKEQLVAKACATLATVLAEGDRSAEVGGSKSPLRLAYACAFDDSNCGEGDDALFRPDRLGRRTPQGAVSFEETMSGRLVLPTEGALGPANPYSSCHLPEIIEQFYADLVRSPEALVSPLSRRGRRQRSSARTKKGRGDPEHRAPLGSRRGR